MKKNKQNGITLIALVITIIVLLILAGVSIMTLTGDNGLLAGYRICPPDQDNWDMSVPENRRILKENIIRVGINQIAQIIWKIQIGGLEQLGDQLRAVSGIVSHDSQSSVRILAADGVQNESCFGSRDPCVRKLGAGAGILFCVSFSLDLRSMSF